MKQRWWGTALLLAACGGSTTPVQPVKSAAGAVQGFMQAVADSNLAKMATLWGTASGPAAKTHQPPDYERRIAIMQAYLRSDSYRLTTDVPESDGRRALQVEIKRQTCTWSVPFIAVKTGDGSWLVNQVDLTAAGNPARPCVEGAGSDSIPS
ncbi:MAG TPA: hypothetical protein VGJ36_00090 [Gemmatimonadales bacterium]